MHLQAVVEGGRGTEAWSVVLTVCCFQRASNVTRKDTWVEIAQMLTQEVEEDVEEAVSSVGKMVTLVEIAPTPTRPPVVAALAGEVVSNVTRRGI